MKDLIFQIIWYWVLDPRYWVIGTEDLIYY
jgi:hypothetical protein